MADTTTNNTETKTEIPAKVSPANDVFAVRAKVLFEGIEVPYSSFSVSYGISGLPTCTVVLPAARSIRDLPETTKVWIIYKNPEDTEDSPWLVLFDGELGGMNYSYNASSGVLMFNVVHSLDLLDRVQLLTQDAALPLKDIGNIAYAGNVACSKIAGTSVADTVVIDSLFGDSETRNKDRDNIPIGKVKGMASVVVALIKAILNDCSTAPATRVFKERIMEKAKLVKRFCFVDSAEEKIIDGIIDKNIPKVYEKRNAK